MASFAEWSRQRLLQEAQAHEVSTTPLMAKVEATLAARANLGYYDAEVDLSFVEDSSKLEELTAILQGQGFTVGFASKRTYTDGVEERTILRVVWPSDKVDGGDARPAAQLANLAYNRSMEILQEPYLEPIYAALRRAGPGVQISVRYAPAVAIPELATSVTELVLQADPLHFFSKDGRMGRDPPKPGKYVYSWQGNFIYYFRLKVYLNSVGYSTLRLTDSTNGEITLMLVPSVGR